MEYNITYGDKVPGAQVVSLELAKENSAIHDTDTSPLYQLLLDAAVEDVENYICSSVLEKDTTISLKVWPETFEFPINPVNTITEITYVDANGVTQTVATVDYVLYQTQLTSKLKFTWDSPPELQDGNEFPVVIKCVSGYTSSTVPTAIKSAVLLRFSHRERFREEVQTSYNRSFYAALRPYKKW